MLINSTAVAIATVPKSAVITTINSRISNSCSSDTNTTVTNATVIRATVNISAVIASTKSRISS